MITVLNNIIKPIFGNLSIIINNIAHLFKSYFRAVILLNILSSDFYYLLHRFNWYLKLWHQVTALITFHYINFLTKLYSVSTIHQQINILKIFIIFTFK